MATWHPSTAAMKVIYDFIITFVYKACKANKTKKGKDRQCCEAAPRVREAERSRGPL